MEKINLQLMDYKESVKAVEQKDKRHGSRQRRVEKKQMKEPNLGKRGIQTK